MISDGTIFQSEWSRKENYRLGLSKNQFDVVIHNAVNSDIFNKKNRIAYSDQRKIKLITTSWSTNPGKGFDVFNWLDLNLDFSKYDMSFVGNSPIRFKNIKHIGPVNSTKLAGLLKEHDIFIFGSRIEACSNALLEALNCGLPSIAYDFSSNPEIIGQAGEFFNKPDEIPVILNQVVNNYHDYQAKIFSQSIEKIATGYIGFVEMISDRVINSVYTPKKLDLKKLLQIFIWIFIWRINSKLISLNSSSHSNVVKPEKIKIERV